MGYVDIRRLTTGAVLIMSDLSGMPKLVKAEESVAADSAASAVRRARELLDDGDVCEARELVIGALDAGGTRAVLLWTLADVEFADDDLIAGQALLAEAVDESGQDAAAVARQLHVLSRNGLWRDVLLTAEELPADLRQDPLVRAEAGDFYRICGCPAHASECYGSPEGLRRSARVARRWCRLRSGGPFALIRRKSVVGRRPICCLSYGTAGAIPACSIR